MPRQHSERKPKRVSEHFRIPVTILEESANEDEDVYELDEDVKLRCPRLFDSIKEDGTLKLFDHPHINGDHWIQGLDDEEWRQVSQFKPQKLENFIASLLKLNNDKDAKVFAMAGEFNELIGDYKKAKQECAAAHDTLHTPSDATAESIDQLTRQLDEQQQLADDRAREIEETKELHDAMLAQATADARTEGQQEITELMEKMDELEIDHDAL
jgi:hypothetical protein